MKIVRTGIIAGLAFFLSAGISFGADLGDIELTIRVVESDDVGEMRNELSLPDVTFDVMHEHEEGGVGHEGQGDVAGHENEAEALQGDEVDARDEREDEIEDHDEAREDNADVSDEHDEAHEDEDHEEEHKKEDS